MTREEKIKAINAEIAEVIEFYQWPDSWPWYDMLPVMIWDVLDWQYKTPWVTSCPNTRKELVEQWGEFRKPIEEQDDECIEYIYNLIK